LLAKGDTVILKCEKAMGSTKLLKSSLFYNPQN